jgi:hypothetical protein
MQEPVIPCLRQPVDAFILSRSGPPGRLFFVGPLGRSFLGSDQSVGAGLHVRDLWFCGRHKGGMPRQIIVGSRDAHHRSFSCCVP